MRKPIIFILFILQIVTSATIAQDVVFSASARDVVRTGERFQIIYTLNANGKEFRTPDMKDFMVISGPHTSQSSSIQIINGKVSRSVENSYTLYVVGNKDGIFTIPPATIKVDDKTYKSNAVKIQVVKSNNQAQQQGSSGGSNARSGSSTPSSNSSTDIKDDVFIRVLVDKRNPGQGEQILATYKLYFRINISSPQFNKEPSFPGFWVNNLLKNSTSYKQYEETYKGKRYNVAEIKKYALFPQRSGKLVIEPAEAMCQAQLKTKTQRRSNDPFFDNFFNDPFYNRYKTVDLNLTTKPITINVKPLPSQNMPADFNGAVGEFDFSSSIDKSECKANDAITLKFTVSGKGNVELVDKLEVSFPPDFEVYDPKISKKITTTQYSVSGRKTFEYLIIPRNPGSFNIPPVKFSYYSLKKKKYITLQSPEYNIIVAKGDGSSSGVSYSDINQKDINYIGTDIRHIKITDSNLKPIGLFFFNSLSFYIWLFAPVVLFILFVVFWKKEFEKRSNAALMRNRKATKVAHSKLKKAHSFMKERKKDEFFIEISQALWGYLSDKFSIPLSNLSIDTVHDIMINKDVKEDSVKTFIDTLNNCEFARFAPGGSADTMENIYNEAVNAISLLESELK